MGQTLLRKGGLSDDVGVLVSKSRKLSPLGWFGWMLYQPYKWLICAPFLAATTLVFSSAAIGLSLFLPSRSVSLICGTSWSRLNAWLTPMPVKVMGRENINPQQSYVVVANHQSFYDVFVLYGFLGIDFKWVMKQEMRSIPGVGIGCEKVGHIFIDRSNRKSALASIKSASRKISNGTSVVFFPEGTRSRDGTLQKLKKGAFRFALDLDLPILPVTIVGTGDVLPSDSLDLLPGKVRLIIDEPILVDSLDGTDIPRLMEQVRSIFEDNTKRPVGDRRMNDAWRKRWQQGHTGWHESAGNRNLKKYWRANGNRVLVPMCGKTPDMLWLEEQGNEVVGVELSEIAVQAFFDEHGLKYERSNGTLVEYRAIERRITLHCGDYFKFSDAGFDAHYDRGALVALPANTRLRYAQHTSSLLTNNAEQLVITVEYDQVVCDGPPFSVSASEIHSYWPRLNRVAAIDDIENAPPKFLAAGLDVMKEVVWRTS